MPEIKNIEEVVMEVKKLSDLVEAATKSAQIKQKEEEVKNTTALEAITKTVSDFKEAQEKGLTDQMVILQKTMQDQYDKFVSKRAPSTESKEPMGLDTAIAKSLSHIKFVENQENEMTETLRKQRSFKLDLPEVKSVTLAGNLTGDPVASYGQRQGILPSQKVNFRDLIPTLNTETGLYVFYRETPSTNNFAFQQEGCTKGENNYTLSEVKVVQNYLAGTTTFSKQMATSLPWLTTTLPRLLMRDFFKKENALFYATINAAATVDTSAETDYVKKLIDFITAQQDLNYDVSAAIVSYTDLGSLLKSTYTAGYYSGAGGVIINGQANGLMIMGVPVIGASWATNGRVLCIDNNFIERVQVKGLAIELSYENNDNFVRNMITARAECQEEVNMLLNASASYCTLY